MKFRFNKEMPWHVHLTLLVLLLFVSCNQERPVDYIDPFICTEGDHGQWLPAALVPFGLVELCPDTWPGSLTADGDFAHSGYNYSDNHIRGFSHFHRGSSGGTSVGDRAGIISLLPFTGEPAGTFFLNPVAEIDKKSEKATAGYYSVKLTQDEIVAELAAAVHSGIHRYSFPDEKEAKLFLCEGDRGGAGGISFKLSDENCIEGSVGNKYFVMMFDSPIASTTLWDGEKLENGESLYAQDNGGIICDFGNLYGNSLIVKVGVSLISIENARENLDLECPHWNFDRIRDEASGAWNKILSSIKVEGSNPDDKKIFYTALYHTCFLPVIQTDVDGTYPGLDRQVHKAEGYTHYDGFAFWDSFRTQYPLFSLFIPGIYSDITSSLLDLYQQADNWGSIPGSAHPPHGVIFKAAGKNGYQIFASCRHEHMLMVVADAYFKGLIRAADGTWLDFPEDPAMNREKYTYEGSKWHWRWNVIHDVPSLIGVFGGKDSFVRELEYFFDNDLYTAGNQIDLQAPFLFNMAGSSWLTQKWVRKLLTEPVVQKYGTHNLFAEPVFDRIYKTTPDGYLEEMDDDYGCMSGWYAMAAMGLYEMCPGNPVYQITAPIFDEVTINLDRSIYKGKKFIIKSEGLSKENIYIQSATLNGKPLNRSSITHDEITAGGELVFKIGPDPNKTWGI